MEFKVLDHPAVSSAGNQLDNTTDKLNSALQSAIIYALENALLNSNAMVRQLEVEPENIDLAQVNYFEGQMRAFSSMAEYLKKQVRFK